MFSPGHPVFLKPAHSGAALFAEHRMAMGTKAAFATCVSMPERSAAFVPFALAVDDDAIIRSAVVDILEEAGFRTLSAEDGDAAVSLLEREHASIVVLFSDVQMPSSRDGFALAREVASRWPHIRIVVASGEIKPKPGDMPEGARFLAKPFSAETVHGHLKEILPDGQKPEPLRR